MTASMPSESFWASPTQDAARLPIRVVVVDDHELLRDTIRDLLLGMQDMEWVGEAADGDDAVALVEATRPDVVLMDLSMPGTDGLSATRLIVRSCPSARVLVLTSSTDPDHEALSLAAGASGVLSKDGNPATLLSGIRAVVRGGQSGPMQDPSS
ncbi:response regulator transcription factor [Knoellia sp. S7-12]|uniref:response regulator n=1 Tax=Knoellia sp. S7-12 TaxID=3126698 RepID=UPI0033689006